MNPHPYTRPFYIFSLTLPAGLSQGFITVALPYMLTKHGFSVAQAASIIAVGFSANIWRFVWGPIVDISLSLKKWFWISLVLSSVSLLFVCFHSFNAKEQGLLTFIVFASQVACTFMLLPVNGFMAKCIREDQKGKAAGWYQAGSLTGVGVGGGAGLWLATHYSAGVAGIVLCAASLVFALVILLMKDVPHERGKTILQELTGMGKDIFLMLKIPVALLVVFLVISPIGTGAAANLWSAIAVDWNTGADTVALVTGVLSGFVSAVGCVAGGIIVDRWGYWITYLGSGIFCAAIALVMALSPLEPSVYIAGVLAYTFGIGLINAAFTSVILYAIGKRNVVTKYSLLTSLGNLPVVYMTAFDGWAHDRYNSKYMLFFEAVAGVLFIIIFFLIIRHMTNKKLIPAAVD